MSRSKEYNRQYMRQRRADPQHRVKDAMYKPGKHLPFAGVDGEGGNIETQQTIFGQPDSRHEYFLLRAGEHTLRTGQPLTARECLAFLADLPKDKIYVGYYFDYDVTMILRGLPRERIKRVLHAAYNVSTRIDDDFEVRYMPHKEFAVRRLPRAKGEEPGPFTVVNDVGPFFQSSFVEALEDWCIGTVFQRQQIGFGKGQREDFGEIDDDIDAYNALEITLLENLMEDYREACIDAGYLPGKWQGPGWLASSLLRAHDAPRTKDLGAFRNETLKRLANEAYYGGRFEIVRVGPVPGPVYEYDINSAYPDALRHLPCLICGTWAKRKIRPADGTLWFGRVEFEHKATALICNLPVRGKDGGIFFPVAGNGVYWSVEVEAAERAGTVVDEVKEAYEYLPGKVCTHRPYAWVQELYAYRLSLGKQGKGKVIKLGMNSVYGKKAQSIGQPAYANAVEAGLITALTRAKIIDAYASRPGSVVMIATDAVYMSEPVPELDCDPGKKLGAWELTEHAEGLFIVQSGVYFGMVDGKAHNRTRGISAKAFGARRAQFEQAFAYLTYERNIPDAALHRDSVVTMNTRIFLNLKLANAWNKPELAGQWFQCPEGADHTRAKPRVCTCRDARFNWTGKRERRLYSDGAGWFTVPRVGRHVSVPYDKRIGGVPAEVRDWRDTSEGQPDWNLELFSEHG